MSGKNYFKTLYGYDDEIKLNDNDIPLLEQGSILLKMNNRDRFNNRSYKLDMKNNTLVASTKEFRKKQKLCNYIIKIINQKFVVVFFFQFLSFIDPLTTINEVKIGCDTDSLKSFKLKKGIDRKYNANELVSEH
jgi:hypothetical protein